MTKFRKQQRNANKHTDRGLQMLSESIVENGWIGAITVAADGETFDGSARLETGQELFENNPIIVETDGSRAVVVKRIDIPTADDQRAKKLAIAANRIAQIDLDWDVDILGELEQEIDLTNLFNEDELESILLNVEKSSFSEEKEFETVDEFKEFDEDIDTEHCCPKCGYKWSGKA